MTKLQTVFDSVLDAMLRGAIGKSFQQSTKTMEATEKHENALAEKRTLENQEKKQKAQDQSAASNITGFGDLSGLTIENPHLTQEELDEWQDTQRGWDQDFIDLQEENKMLSQALGSISQMEATRKKLIKQSTLNIAEKLKSRRKS